MASRQEPRPINYSSRVADLHASPIREILSVISQPGMISFAGGLPSAETFPDFDIGAVPPQYLQYGPTEGEPELRRQVAAEMAAIGLDCAPGQVLILSGSQQGIDLVAKLLVDPGTQVAVESPTYLAALQVFRFFGAQFNALDPQQPQAALSAGKTAFAYAIPTFQNPTGRCYSTAERDALAQACDASGTLLFEDDPYRDLAFDAVDRAPVCARLRHAPWIYQGSFSKSLAPGLRLGFMVASPGLIPYLTRLKQAADLHSNRISQWLVLEQLRSAERTQRISMLVTSYRDKRDRFAASLERHFSDLASWQIPPGGLFFWLDLKQHCDTRSLLPRAIEQGVAFMPGEPFFPQAVDAASALRLNFSHSSADDAERGLATLAALIRQGQ
jgi:DNA-binding transcriptional MocR family regulator